MGGWLSPAGNGNSSAEAAPEPGLLQAQPSSSPGSHTKPGFLGLSMDALAPGSQRMIQPSLPALPQGPQVTPHPPKSAGDALFSVHLQPQTLELRTRTQLLACDLSPVCGLDSVERTNNIHTVPDVSCGCGSGLLSQLLWAVPTKINRLKSRSTTHGAKTPWAGEGCFGLQV